MNNIVCFVFYGFRREVKGTDAVTGAHGSRRIMGGSAISSAGTSGITTRRTNLRSSSGCGSTQRLSGGNRDHSVTQFALIDDENVSALQQVRDVLKMVEGSELYFIIFGFIIFVDFIVHRLHEVAH